MFARQRDRFNVFTLEILDDDDLDLIWEVKEGRHRDGVVAKECRRLLSVR